MRLSDYVIDKLVSIGVNKIFLVTGRGALFLTDSVARNKNISAVCTHHEQSAAYAAVAYSQYYNAIGACIVSTGCASTNAVTGVLSAYQDGLPVIFISGQNSLKETTYFTKHNIRTYGQQEANIVDIVKSITKYAVTITDPSTIRYHLEKAIYLANEGVKGPVWIDIPLDLQSAQIDQDNLCDFDEVRSDIQAPETDIKYIKDCLSASNRPVILIGSGIRSAEVIDEFKHFININQIPVVYTASAPDVFSLSQSLSIGSVGSMGCSRAGAFAVQNADFVIVLGNRLSSITTGTDRQKFARDAKLIVVDIDDAEHTKSDLKIDKIVIQDLRNLFNRLGNHQITKGITEWVKKCLHWKEIFANERHFESTDKIDIYHLVNELSSCLDDDAIIITDSGFIEVILPTNLDYKANRRAIHPISQGAMGFAIPAMLGMADVDRQIVVVVGDGSFMMNMQELESIRYNKVISKIIVLNNNVYSIIRRRQKELFRSRTIGTDPSNGVSVPNFSKVADLFDFKYVNISNPVELRSKLVDVLKCKETVLCEIICKENQEYIEISHAKTSNGKFVKRPLEDQWPFLERDIFIKEMIIEPIDQ